MMCDDFFQKSHYRLRSCLLMSLGPWLSALLRADKRFWGWAEKVMLDFMKDVVCMWGREMFAVAMVPCWSRVGGTME